MPPRSFFGAFSLMLAGPASLFAADAPGLADRAIHSLQASNISSQAIVNGNVGSNTVDNLGAASIVNGSVLSTSVIAMNSQARVAGNLTAPTITYQDNTNTVQGVRSPGTPVAAIPIDAPTVTNGTTAMTIARGVVTSLVPGSYGAINVQTGGTLRLQSGVYNLASLNLEPDAVVIAIVSGAIVRVNIAGSANIGDRSTVMVNGGDASMLRFHTNTSSAVDGFRIGTDVNFRGIVSAPRGQIHVYSRSLIYGKLWGNVVTIEPQTTVFGTFTPPSDGASISGSVVNGYRGHVKASFTADNYYALYHGRSNGTDLILSGRNEGNGKSAQPQCQDLIHYNDYNWQCPEQYEFDVGPDDHLYVVVWDGGSYKMWAGNFDLNGTGIIVSDLENWEHFVSRNPRPADDGYPDMVALAKEIGEAKWLPLLISQPNEGIDPYITKIPNLDPRAKLVWNENTFGTSGAPAAPNYVVFRSKAPVIPKRGLSNWVVFLDANRNGLLDAGERSTIADKDGNYSFTGLAAGSYAVAQVLQSGWRLVYQTPAAGQSTTLAQNQAVGNIDFFVQHN